MITTGRNCGRRVQGIRTTPFGAGCVTGVVTITFTLWLAGCSTVGPAAIEQAPLSENRAEAEPAMAPVTSVEQETGVPASAQDASMRIVVQKSKRLLHVYSGPDILRTYPIALGFQPLGHKVRQGDGRTPEGEYFIVVKNPKSRFYRSLGISYPNQRDAQRAYVDQRIDSKQYRQIENAERGKRVPPWNTPLGGEIYIHGSGNETDWTAGCIALADTHMRELFEIAPVGAAVTIVP